MPSAPARPCTYPGCRALVRGGSRCDAHPYPVRTGHQGSTNPIYASAKWKAMRKNFLAKYPVCAVCGGPATVVDHVVPVSVSPELAFLTSNFQSLCHRDHVSKTVRLDGGWGHRPRGQQ